MNPKRPQFRLTSAARFGQRPTAHGQRGFTFTEILFAVIILGIGFIMLAAIFPVALQQTKSSTEDTVSAAVSRSALRYMEDLGQQKDASAVPLMVSTGGVVMPLTTSGVLWNAVSGNMIVPNDPRYAWVPLYSRAANSPFAQVFIFVEQVRGDRTQFGAVDLAAPTPNLQARSATVTVTYSATGSTIQFTAGGTSIGEDAYVVTAANGHIYRVGTATGTLNTWYLAPGYEPKDATENLSGAPAYVVGKYSTNGGPDATGLVQDIGCYTSFVRVN
jgi:prepilin-type N-terminal cleavage/methylation domain-containing protein